MTKDSTNSSQNSIHYRPLEVGDLERVPLNCQGSLDEVRARVKDLGTSAILAFDGEQHVGQLQIRRYDRALRSPEGIWDPRYWGDFGDSAPVMPANTVAIFCYHVGQLDASEARDSRYQNRGIGVAMLDVLIEWARNERYAALIAKHTPPYPAVMGFMGGMSASRYEDRGFQVLSSWIDPQLRETVRERELVSETDDIDLAATVGSCVLHLQ